MKAFSYLFNAIIVCLALMGIAGCGSSGSSSGSSLNAAPVTGSVFAGPASGSTVIVKTTTGTMVAGPVTTQSDGSFSLLIPLAYLTSDLVFEASGGTFPDEANPAATSTPFGSLSAQVTAGSMFSGAHVTIDPSTTIIRKLIAGGMTRTEAETAFNGAFGFIPDSSVRPVFAAVSSAATDKQRLSGLRTAAFSQLTRDMSLQPEKQFELIDSLADDLSDGTLDGMKNGVPEVTSSGTSLPEDIGNRFNTAMMNFQNGDRNETRLSADRIGSPVFVRTVLTPSYKVEYIPVTMSVQGMTSFRIKVTNRSDGSLAPGKTVTVFPYMYMATKSHTSPVDPVIVDNGDGTYSCSVYYVMATMMNGISMGVWKLSVEIGAEEAVFYPTVAMPMGNTTLTKLSGVADAITGMAGVEKRTYFLFSEGYTAGVFKLFIATKENMTSFPAVVTGKQLKDENGNYWTVNSMVVEASTDAANWVTATDSGNGHWTATGLSGLASGVAGKIYVRLTVNGEQKTTNGSPVAADNANAFQTFNVTP